MFRCRFTKLLIFSVIFYVLSEVPISAAYKTSDTTQLDDVNDKNSDNQSRAEKNYYSDIDEEYEREVKSFRDLGSKIILGIIAFSFLASLVILIVVIHLRSRKVSQLKHLI